MPMSEYLSRLRERVGHDLLQMPCATGVVRDGERILLLRRSDNGRWSLPGGAIDPGEHPAQALVREVWEETGLRVRPRRLLGVFGNIRIVYPNADEVEVVTTVFDCETLGGELQCRDGEATDLRYFAIGEMPELMTRYPRRIFEAAPAEPCFTWREEWLRA